MSTKQKWVAHTCLSCGCAIAKGEEQEQVPGNSNPVRYRHKTWEGCQKALTAMPAREFQQYESRRDTTGVVFPAPTLAEQEDAL